MKAYLLAWFCLFTVICAVIYQANPKALLLFKDRNVIIGAPIANASIQHKKLDSTCVATGQYRYDQERRGVATTTDSPSVDLKITKRVAPFNVGIHNASKATPVADQTGVYVGSDSGWFFKMNHQGEILWRFYVPGSKNGIHGSAAMDDKKVYFGAYNGALYALDKNDGTPVWTNFVADFIGASPLLADNGLFISAETRGPNGLVARMDCNTGAIHWVSEWLGGHSHSSPAFDPLTGSILVGANSGRLFSLDVDSGKTRWNLQSKGPIKGTPMVDGSTVYVTSWDKHLYAVAIQTGEVLWQTFMGGKLQTSLTKVPGQNLGLTNTRVGELVGVDLKTGNIQWRLRHGDRDHLSSFLVTMYKGKAIAWNRCKKSRLCALDAKTGKLIRDIQLPGTFTSSPMAYKDKIYISLDQNAGLVILN